MLLQCYRDFTECFNEQDKFKVEGVVSRDRFFL